MRLSRAVPLVLALFFTSVSNAATVQVRPDGTGDFATIQAAVDAAAEGDTILLSAGTFAGAGNVNVDSRGKGLVVSGEAAEAATTIECAWTARAFLIHDNISSFFTITHVTIAHGWGGTGGAIRCLNAAVELRDMVITRSIACWGSAIACIDGRASLIRCGIFDNACSWQTPCYGAGAPVCEGLEYGGPIGVIRSDFEMIDSECKGIGDESSGFKVLYAEDSSVEMVGNWCHDNRSMDGGPIFEFVRCYLRVIANEFSRNYSGTSDLHIVQCDGEVRSNIFNDNTALRGMGGVNSENSSVPVTFNWFRGNGGYSVSSWHSTGDIMRNLIIDTIGTCCSSGTAIRLYGCESFQVVNNTLVNNGDPEYTPPWGTEMLAWSNAAWVTHNLIVHDELSPVVDCDDRGCSVPPPPYPENRNWLWGDGALSDLPVCLGDFEFDNPMHRDPAHNNFFLRPSSSCDADTIIGTHVLKWLYGALPKGSRPSGLLNVTKPADAWPVAAQPGTNYVLSGFSITNTYRYGASINYRVTSTSGLLRDGGDPLALVGATPVLAPGESFTPPTAVLRVPAGNRDVTVTYTFAYAPALNIVDTLRTTIHFGNPVPVRVTSFDARFRDGNIVLSWATSHSYGLAGWNVYRAVGDGPFRRITGTPMSPASREFTDSRLRSGEPHRYRLVALDPEETIVGEINVTPQFKLALEQNSPNPFRTETTIRFSMPRAARAELNVYAVDGSLVRTLLNERVQDNVRAVSWDGRDADGKPVPSGVYFCRLTVDAQVLTRKIVLAR